MSTFCNFTTAIDENQCIGDSLDTFNANFSAIDTNVCTIVNQYNTLIRTLTAFAASPATTYTGLSTQFLSLNSLIIS